MKQITFKICWNLCFSWSRDFSGGTGPKSGIYFTSLVRVLSWCFGLDPTKNCRDVSILKAMYFLCCVVEHNCYFVGVLVSVFVNRKVFLSMLCVLRAHCTTFSCLARIAISCWTTNKQMYICIRRKLSFVLLRTARFVPRILRQTGDATLQNANFQILVHPPRIVFHWKPIDLNTVHATMRIWIAARHTVITFQPQVGLNHRFQSRREIVRVYHSHRVTFFACRKKRDRYSLNRPEKTENRKHLFAPKDGTTGCIFQQTGIYRDGMCAWSIKTKHMSRHDKRSRRGCWCER